MEWFALAVDSVILVIGLIYYIFKYIHDHKTNKISSYLKIISNTGNNFYKNMILAFSNINTILIGISFLLTIHLIVDVGVYMVPYTVGVENSLYFTSLDAGGTDHTPLFNFLNFENSQFYKDINLTYDYFLILIIILIYLISCFLIISLMILPFYIFYKNIQREKFKINNLFGTLFLISITFFSIIIFLPNINNPISIGTPNVENINGVDIYTNQIIKNLDINNFKKVSSELLVSIIIFLTITIFLLFRYEKYKFFFDKIILILVLIFFIYYISIFFYSTIQKEYTNLFPNYNSVNDFNNINNLYLDDNLFKNKNSIDYNFDNINFKINIFSNESFNNILNKLPHKDYMRIEITNYSKNYNINFKEIPKVYFSNNQIYAESKFNLNNLEIIYYLGENYILIDKINRDTILNQNLDKNKFNSFIELNKQKTFNDFIIKLIEYLRLIFISIFYIFGSFAFIWHYTKTNIYNF